MTGQWTWFLSLLALIVFLDVCALSWYFWSIPEQVFQRWEKILSTVATWLTTILVSLGIRYTFGNTNSVADVLRLRPVQLSIAALTIIIWYFILPFHNVTLKVKDESGHPIQGASVFVDEETSPRPTNSDTAGRITVSGLQVSPHSLRLSRRRYDETRVTINFTNVIGFAESEVVLANSKGTVALNTKPEGADIYIDHNETTSWGSTPKTISLPVGAHSVLFKKKDYRSSNWEEISINSGNNIPFAQGKILEKIPPNAIHSLIVSSRPEGARFYVNKIFTGTTPDTIRVPKGSHMVEFQKERYLKKQTMVEIPRQTTVAVDLEKVNTDE